MSVEAEEAGVLSKGYGLYPHRYEPDRWMLRLRLPGGRIQADLLRVLSRIVAENGTGFADLTTRQGVQLRGLRGKALSSQIQALESMGLSAWGTGHDTLRNIVGCPVASVDPKAPWDVAPLLQQVNDYFQNNPEGEDFPRKLKVSLSACASHCTQPEIHCVSFVGFERMQEGQREVGFDLRVGGGLSRQGQWSQRLNRFVKPEQVLPTLRAIARLYREAGEYRQQRLRGRLRFLIADWGLKRFCGALEEQLGFPLTAAGSLTDPPDGHRDHVGVHEQKQPGLFYIGLPVPVGRISCDQMDKVADLAQRYGDGSVCLTVQQNLLLLNIPEARVAQVLEGCEAVHLRVNASPLLRGLVACGGIASCRLGMAETKERAREILEYLQPHLMLEEPLRIHLDGCPAGCAHSPIAHIGLQGTQIRVGERWMEAFDVAVGGSLGSTGSFHRFVARGIPAGEIKFRLERLLLGYKRSRKGQESFNDFCRRLGDEAVGRMLAPAEKGAG